MRVKGFFSCFSHITATSTGQEVYPVSTEKVQLPNDLFLLAERPHGGSGISKEEADGLKADLQEIREVARERQAKLDALEQRRQETDKRWLEVVLPHAMTFIERAKALIQSAESLEASERAMDANRELGAAENVLNEGSDWLSAQCTRGFADSGQALTLHGHLSTRTSHVRSEVSRMRASLEFKEEQKKAGEHLRLLHETLAALQARSDANDQAQKALIADLTRSLEAGREKQQELEAQSRAAEVFRAAQHEETQRANAYMQQTMDEMAAAQMAARAGLYTRSAARRPESRSRSVSLRGPILRRVPVSDAARDIASRLVDGLPAEFLARAADHSPNDAEVREVLASEGEASQDRGAAALLLLYLRDPGQSGGIWAESHRLAQQVLASLTALTVERVTANPPRPGANQELWAMQVRRNMTCGETPLGRSVDRCLAALRRAESITQSEAENDFHEDAQEYAGLAPTRPADVQRTPNVAG